MNNTEREMERERCFRQFINDILENCEVYCDEGWWRDESAQEELTALASAKNNYITDSQAMNMEGVESIFAVYRDDDGTFKDKVQDRISGQFAHSKKSHVQRIFFVKDMSSRIFLEKMFDRSIICVLVEEYAGQEVKLRSLNRYEMIQEPPICGNINLEKPSGPSGSAGIKSVEGLVCTVDLFQIVELYNMLGDQLFKYNVRIGIKETLGVDSAIRRTLETEPDCFWFKNNGITILVENPDFKVNNTEELLLGWVEAGKELGFSVVNGAQTINTAAQYFYELKYQRKNGSSSEQKDSEEKEKLFKKARVLLRVIHVPAAEDVKEPSSMAKEISVALNRQKPIKMEDIAFTNPFVEKLTRYLAEGNIGENSMFQLVRRGEKMNKYNQIDLVDFSRSRLACAGYPGDARTEGVNKLLELRLEEGENTFANKIIFTSEWLPAEGSRVDDIFRRDYQAVLCAHRIAMEYNKKRRGVLAEVKQQDKQNVIKNGKWYFTAFLIQMLIDYQQYEPAGSKSADTKLPDFSNFECSMKSILDCIDEAVSCFADIVTAYSNKPQANAEYKELDSNVFKKNGLYEDMIKELRPKDKPTSEKGSRDLFFIKCQEFADVFGLKPSFYVLTENSPDEADEESDIDRTGKYVRLGQDKYPVQSDAEALARMVEYILEYCPADEEWLEETDGWITDDKRIGLGGQKYFRGSPRLVIVKGTNYWVGTHSNTQTKCRQLQQLCRLTGVPHGTISWYKNSETTPEFTW